ncbi:hypothetical protein [Anaerovorax odorimutans]|nr:hypothetical protein [Anaerovorax odorimutans]
MKNILTIGSNCFYQALSVILKRIDLLDWVLEYSEPCFIYNKDYYIDFERDDPEKTLAKENPLIFDHDPVSSYYNDYITKCNNNYKESLVSECEYTYMEDDSTLNFNDINEHFFSNHIQVAISIDTYYLLEDYIKKRCYFEKWHNYHFVVIDHLKNSKCYIIDNYFNFEGYVDTKKLDIAYHSIEKDRGRKRVWWIDSNKLGDLQKNLNRDNHLLTLCKRYLNKRQSINEHEYITNSEGIRVFNQDYKDIAQILNNRYGQYAPQHILYALMGFYLQKLGLSQLFIYLNENNINAKLENLSYYYNESEKYWSKFTRILERTYLKRKSVIDTIDNIHNVLSEIQLIESHIEEETEKIKEQIENGENVLI